MTLEPREAYYRARVTPCVRDAARLRDNIAYAILSVHSSTRETDLLFSAWRDAGRPFDGPDIADAWQDVGAQFKNQKEAWLSGLGAVSDEWIIEHARDREALDTLPGLGMIKASFAAALNGASVACLDRHIVRSLRAGKLRALRAAGVRLELCDKRLAPKTWRAYRALENILRARCAGVADLFVAQWRTWNALRETDETHAILWKAPETGETVPF